MCVHRWARYTRCQDGHVIYNCTECQARVDFTASREEWDRLEPTSPTAPPMLTGTEGSAAITVLIILAMGIIWPLMVVLMTGDSHPTLTKPLLVLWLAGWCWTALVWLLRTA